MSNIYILLDRLPKLILLLGNDVLLGRQKAIDRSIPLTIAYNVIVMLAPDDAEYVKLPIFWFLLTKTMFSVDVSANVTTLDDVMSPNVVVNSY